VKNPNDGRYSGTFYFTYPDGKHINHERGDIEVAIVRKAGSEIALEYVEGVSKINLNLSQLVGNQFVGRWTHSEGTGDATLKVYLSENGFAMIGAWVNKESGEEGIYVFELLPTKAGA
jgi:hypothetical protein